MLDTLLQFESYSRNEFHFYQFEFALNESSHRERLAQFGVFYCRTNTASSGFSGPKVFEYRKVQLALGHTWKAPFIREFRLF